MSNTYKTIREFRDNMLSELIARTDKIKSFNNDVVDGLFHAIASQLGHLQLLTKFIFRSFYTATCEDKFLDAKGADWLLTRKPSLYAAGLVRIERTNTDVPLIINPNEVFTTEVDDFNNRKEYVLTEYVTMNVGENYAYGEIQSLKIGEIGNTSANTIIRSKRGLAGISSITNEEPLINGRNLETNYTFRNRINLKKLGQIKATERSIRSDILEINGIDYCYTNTNILYPGVIYVYINNKAGNIEYDTNAIDEAITKINESKAFGIIHILQTSPVENVDLYVKIGAVGSFVDEITLKQIVRSILTNYVNSLEPSRELRTSDLIGIIEQIENVQYVVNDNGIHQIKISSKFTDYIPKSKLTLIRTAIENVVVEIE